MQRNNECVKCGIVFDNKKRKPLRLECQHVMCAQCTREFYAQNNMITCPMNCELQTDPDPFNLEVVSELIPKQGQLKLNECEDHQGQFKMLFCKQDMITICPVCAQYTQTHKGHDIVDIKDQVDILKQNEVKDSKEKVEKIKKTIEKSFDFLINQKQKNKTQVEIAVNKINDSFEGLKIRLTQIQHSVTGKLLDQQQQYQNEFEEQIKLVQNIEAKIQNAQPRDEENVTELLDFVGQVNQISQQVNNIQLKEIELEFQEQQNLIQEIENQAHKFTNFQYNEKLVNFDEPEQQLEPQGQTYSTVLGGTKTQRTYSFGNKNFQNQDINIPTAINNGCATYVEQIGEDKLLISGFDSASNYQSFVYFNQNQCQQFQMTEKRQWHRTAFDSSSEVDFIISGYNQASYTQKCEIFDFKNNQFRNMADIITPVHLFGCCLAQTQVLVFGGYGNGQLQDAVQIYNTGNNQWVQNAAKLPTKAYASAAYLKNLNSGLVYDNGSKTLDTLIFDFNNLIRHGEQFKGSGAVYTNAIMFSNTVYQFDYTSNLFSYEMSKAKWEQVQ